MGRLYHKKTDKITVIIVEDEPPMLRFLHRLLSDMDGFLVVGECLSAQEALNLAQTSAPDLLISDIRMPGMSGLQLAEWFRGISADMHIVIITGYKSFEYAKTAINLNIDAFITKPIDQQEFREVLFQIRKSWQKRIYGELRSRLEKAVQYNNEEDFAQILSGQHSGTGMCMVFYAGDMGELFSCMKQWKGGQLFLVYKSMAVFFTDESQKEELFHYLCVKFGGSSRQRQTAVCVQMNALKRSVPTISEIKEFYRKPLLQIMIYGRFISCSGDALQERMERSAAWRRDEADFRKLEMTILARRWDQLWERMEQLLEVWEKEQAPVWCMRKRIHSILVLCSEAGILKNDAMVLTDQIRENLVCFDSYAEARKYFTAVLKTSIEIGECGPSNREAELFSRIRNLVFQSLNRNYSLQEVCAIFEVSQPYVRKIFTQFTGKTYNDFVLEEKMNAAVDLMNRNPGIPVKELAALLGYDPLYFGTVFKKSIGLSPSQYKQALAGTGKAPESCGGRKQDENEE